MRSFIYLSALLAVCTSASAVEYVNMDFTAPEKGDYRTVFGTPTVQSSAGPLNNALVFDAVSTYEQISISVPASSIGYEVNYDIYTHNLRDSKYAFTVLFDTPEVRTMSFHGGANGLYVFRPGHLGWGGPFYDDQVHHVRMMVDFRSNDWIINLDGQDVASMDFDATTVDTIRFSLSPWYANSPDGPGTFVALDNLTIATVPEPPVWALILVSGIPLGLWHHRRRQAGSVA